MSMSFDDYIVHNERIPEILEIHRADEPVERFRFESKTQAKNARRLLTREYLQEGSMVSLEILRDHTDSMGEVRSGWSLAIQQAQSEEEKTDMPAIGEVFDESTGVAGLHQLLVVKHNREVGIIYRGLLTDSVTARDLLRSINTPIRNWYGARILAVLDA